MTPTHFQSVGNGLVISDDRTVALRYGQLLRRFTRRVGISNTADAVRTIAFQTVNAVILDAGLRTNEFLAIIERFHAQGKGMDVLAVVAAASLPRIRVPQRLVTDFVVEGASDAEILARLRFLLAPRESDETEAALQDGALTLDFSQHKIYLEDRPLSLAHIEYSLLAFFLTHPNRTYPRAELLRRVWGSTSDAPSRTVDVHVRRIRAKLGAAVDHRLDTVRGVGYLWHAEPPE
ncbi:MAG: response regulator transcription factor [Actinomycetes bacterium]|jgi:DNA-binding response OmpR family regulator|nr:response regulator transcription factor [Actinomycetes bacterium]